MYPVWAVREGEMANSKSTMSVSQAPIRTPPRYRQVLLRELAWFERVGCGNLRHFEDTGLRIHLFLDVRDDAAVLWRRVLV